MSNVMLDISNSLVEKHDIMNWLSDYATPRIRILRAMLALKQLAEPVAKNDKVPSFIMPENEYKEFRKMLNAVAKTESMALAFEPLVHKSTHENEAVGLLFGCMPVKVKKNQKEITCVPVEEN